MNMCVTFTKFKQSLFVMVVGIGMLLCTDVFAQQQPDKKKAKEIQKPQKVVREKKSEKKAPKDTGPKIVLPKPASPAGKTEEVKPALTKPTPITPDSPKTGIVNKDTLRAPIHSEDEIADAPGEKEFNQCLKYPVNRRIKFNLKPNSELQDIVGWISSMTCKRFIIADNMRAQKITILSPTPVTPAEAYRAFLSALDVMGLTVVPSGKYLKIVQGNWAIQSSIPTYGLQSKEKVPTSDEIVTQLVRIQNVDVNELMPVLTKMKSRSGDVTAYKPTNVLIITDLGSNIKRLLTITKELDVPIVGEKIWVIRLKFADADEINKILSQLFTQKGPGQAVIPRIIRPGRTDEKTTELGDDSASLSASKIVSDIASNSLIIVASPSAFTKIASLIKKLDVEIEGVRQQVHVYYLENADAEEIAGTLANLAGRGGAVQQTRGHNRGQPRAAATAQTATLFEGEMQISSDKATNSLVIVASPRDYLSLSKVIKKLDIPRRQVFIEAYIMEISLNNERKLGFAYHGGGVTGTDTQSIIFGGVQHGGLGSLVIDPLALMGLAVGARGAVISGSGELTGLGADIPGFGVFFQALQTNGDVNVLSSPHLLTTDNEEAEITVGQNVPFQGGFMGGGMNLGALGQAAGATNLGSFLPTVSVQRQDVALKLKLTPHVNESEMVRLELEQEVSDIVDKDFNGLGPATSKRSVKTTIVVRDQQTVVIGGLIRDKISNSVSKVPLLGDIPILGYLFKHRTKSVEKTNLLIVLTPYVIRDQGDLRNIFKKKIQDRREFIERYTSFEHKDIGQDIDYRHKRGVLSEINRVGHNVEEEAKLMDEAKKATEETVTPLDIPEGMDASTASSTTTSSETQAVPTSPTQPVPPPSPAEMRRDFDLGQPSPALRVR